MQVSTESLKTESNRAVHVPQSWWCKMVQGKYICAVLPLTYLFIFSANNNVILQPVELWTKHGRRGRIKETVGTHGVSVDQSIFFDSLDSVTIISISLFLSLLLTFSFPEQVPWNAYSIVAFSSMILCAWACTNVLTLSGLNSSTMHKICLDVYLCLYQQAAAGYPDECELANTGM